MRWSRSLIPTLRQAPAEAVAPSHVLMLRAGLIQQVAAGSYSYLPLGWRVLHKVMNIIRQEMDRAGAVEVFLPTLQPVEWWERTGRRAAYGDNLFVIQDRHGREQALGPTHEEVMTQLIGSHVNSYKQLPLNLYQIQTKFRDEFRPRFGVLRSREFQMKDAYSFHMTLEGPGGLDETYDAMYAAYERIFQRSGVPHVVVEAESGPIGGSASHEFMIPSPTGEDTVLSSDKGNYAANVEKCEIGQRAVSETFAPCLTRKARGTHSPGSDAAARPDARGRCSPGFTPAGEPTGDLEDVHTPDCPGIDDVCAFFKKKLGSKLATKNMLKSLVYVATRESDSADVHEANDPWYVLAVVRGDHDVNEGKLREHMNGLLGEPAHLELAPEDLAKRDGWTIGFVGPHAFAGRDDTYLVVDPDAAQGGFWVTGANEFDHHVKHFNWARELDTSAERIGVADIRNAVAGDPSPKNDGGVLVESKGIEVGHIFKLGCKYTEALGVKVSDENQQLVTPLMGCYGIGVNRILAGAIESEAGHDDGGIIWPMSIAPFHVVITPIKYAPGSEVANVCDDLYEKLTAAGIEVLLDDRDERPGVKFKDADLVGIPLRLTVGDKGLGAPGGAEVEFKPRTADKAEMVKLDDVVDRTVGYVRDAM